MRSVLPGKPQAKLEALCTAEWKGLRLVAYISGGAVIILRGPNQLLQTIYHDEHSELDAIAIDEASGKIATCFSKEVVIYKPFGRDEGLLRWSFQSSFQVSDDEDPTLTLSWGSEEELLVGSSSLRLYQTGEEVAQIWNRQLSKAVRIAKFSYDANFIASTGHHDRLIKLWRRQSFGSNDTRFDFTYLPHPTAVTMIHWRKPYEHEHLTDNVLFSVCGDYKIRMWAGKDPHALQLWQLWAEVDMQEAIQPRELGSPSLTQDRYAFILDSKDFACGVEQAMKAASKESQEAGHALEHLAEVSKTNPEVCVILDRQGNMSAWGLNHVACEARDNVSKFNIAHVENVQLSFPTNFSPGEANIQFLSFCNTYSNSCITLLAHYFDGRIIWYESRLDELFDPAPRQQRLHSRALWTGHDEVIMEIVRSNSGNSIMSCTDENEGLLWKHNHDASSMALIRSGSLSCPQTVHRYCLLEEGDFVVSLHHQSISLWDARSPVARQVASCDFKSEGKPLRLLLLPCPDNRSLCSFVAIITSRMEALVWQVILPAKIYENVDSGYAAKMSQRCCSGMNRSEEGAFVMPVDSSGSRSVVPGFLDPFAKDLVISCTNDGVLQTWTATVDLETSNTNWRQTSTMDMHIEMPFLISESLTEKVAVVDTSKTGLFIWDPRTSQLEHDVKYEPSDTIQHMNWSPARDDRSLLAVGFQYKVVILAQIRYDYMNSGPAWKSIKEINVKEVTSHPIGDSSWLGSGDLVIGAGNQLYVYDEYVEITDRMAVDLSLPEHEHLSLSIFDIFTYLNGPLPFFHPQLLAQCCLHSKVLHVHRILIAFHKALKFSGPGDELDSFVSLAPTYFYEEQEIISRPAKKGMQSAYADLDDDDEPEIVTEEIAASLNDLLADITIPQLSSHEHIQLADISKCIAAVEKHRRSIDENAMLYLLFFRQFRDRKSHTLTIQSITAWRDIVWAYHSDTQDILLDLVSRQYNGRMLWEHARESGVFMWMIDLTALRTQFEVIARNEYTKTDEKNPIDCSLYYLALKKKPVLLGLWRMAAWNREQAGTQKLLRNDFSDPRWKTAALKNAYALMGKRRFEYAAAFFLLADHVQDAVNICAHQMQDIQLAIAVARVYDGDESPVLRSLLEDKVLPQAAQEGNRWMATWAFWMLDRKDKAVRVLFAPISTLVHIPTPPAPQSRSYLSNEPALLVLYKQLREKTTQTPNSKAIATLSPREEWAFVLQTARTYNRMGCHLLALDLVRNWKFLEQPREGMDGTQLPGPSETSRRLSSIIADDLPSSTKQEGKPANEKPAPTTFKEPEASSLLDSFGF